MPQGRRGLGNERGGAGRREGVGDGAEWLAGIGEERERRAVCGRSRKT